LYKSDEVFRAHVVYMNLNNGEEAHEYSKPYHTKGAATRAKNTMKRATFHHRRMVKDPNSRHYARIPDPNDNRTEDELLPFYDSYVERATDWQRV